MPRVGPWDAGHKESSISGIDLGSCHGHKNSPLICLTPWNQPFQMLPDTHTGTTRDDPKQTLSIQLALGGQQTRPVQQGGTSVASFQDELNGDALALQTQSRHTYASSAMTSLPIAGPRYWNGEGDRVMRLVWTVNAKSRGFAIIQGKKCPSKWATICLLREVAINFWAKKQIGKAAPIFSHQQTIIV